MKQFIFLLMCYNTLQCCCLQAQKTRDDKFFLLAGCYSDGTTAGISVFDFDIKTGDYYFLSDIKQIVNPSYLVVSKDEKMVYSVNETQEGAASSFRIDKEKGTLSFVNSEPTKGAAPCYINMDKGQNFIVTANYTGGNISVFTLNKNGSIKNLTAVLSSINKDRASHKHTAIFSPDETRLLVTDLGTDYIYSFEVRPEAKEGAFLVNMKETKLEEGSGPRHLAFHPNGKYLYCINELSGKVAVLTYKDDNLEVIQYIASDTTQSQRRKGSADIHLTSDGRFLYSSNRLRADGIAIFSVNPENGTLTYIGYQSTGIHPRNFIITPNDKFLLCANRDSNNIQIFEINSVTGLLSNTGKEISLDKPVCLKWVGKK